MESGFSSLPEMGWIVRGTGPLPTYQPWIWILGLSWQSTYLARDYGAEAEEEMTISYSG
tara:strand:+ start:398 stop:574 length:177 start_codon:yes stop_codon:yes gene_type:complete